ncbi:hypothetical protein [Spirosoma arcticum]
MLRCPVLIVTLILSCSATVAAQKFSVETYKVRIVTQAGNRFSGVLDDVTDQYLYVEHANPIPQNRTARFPLAGIRKVTVRYNRRKSTLEGAIIGGGLAGFATIRSSKKNGFRSPIVYGLNLAIVVGAGAGIGALIGRKIGPISRRMIRPFGQTPNERAESLRRQLQPFTYEYQNDVLNRVPQ